jgi:hypothetical protein
MRFLYKISSRRIGGSRDIGSDGNKTESKTKGRVRRAVLEAPPIADSYPASLRSDPYPVLVASLPVPDSIDLIPSMWTLTISAPGMEYFSYLSIARITLVGLRTSL